VSAASEYQRRLIASMPPVERRLTSSASSMFESGASCVDARRNRAVVGRARRTIGRACEAIWDKRTERRVSRPS